MKNEEAKQIVAELTYAEKLTLYEELMTMERLRTERAS